MSISNLIRTHIGCGSGGRGGGWCRAEASASAGGLLRPRAQRGLRRLREPAAAGRGEGGRRADGRGSQVGRQEVLLDEELEEKEVQ